MNRRHRHAYVEPVDGFCMEFVKLGPRFENKVRCSRRASVTVDGVGYCGNHGKMKDPDAVSLGRRGGLKGGPARAASMTPEERSESARHAARARWQKNPAAVEEGPAGLLLLAAQCAGCGDDLDHRHRCKPDLGLLPPLRLDAYYDQIYRKPGPWAVDELERILIEYRVRFKPRS